nr:MAG: hypothetical protein [Microvirus sp.]
MVTLRAHWAGSGEGARLQGRVGRRLEVLRSGPLANHRLEKPERKFPMAEEKMTSAPRPGRYQVRFDGDDEWREARLYPNRIFVLPPWRDERDRERQFVVGEFLGE